MIGEQVSTSYGVGKVVAYREDDNVHAVELFGGTATLYTSNTIELSKSFSVAVDASRNGGEEQQRVVVKAPPPSSADKGKKKKKTSSPMQLNIAYESLEKMRKLNLELQCSEAGIVFTEKAPLDFTQCTKCLMEHGPTPIADSLPSPISKPLSTAPALVTSSGRPLFPNLYRLRMESQRLMEKSTKDIIKVVDDQKKKRKVASSPPCLICGSPTCSNHTSPTFRRENITVCNDCVSMFELDVESFDEAQIDKIVDLYDRAVLLLKFSSQFIDDIAKALEESTERQNKVGLGSSSVGVVSGALGIAAACTILTPAGPPLLIASLLFGGSATAVQTGTEAMKYFSEPNKLADRILALHGMVGSIISTTSYIRDHKLVPYLDNALAEDRPMAKQMQQTQNKAMTVGMRMGGGAATGMASFGASFAVQEGAAAGRFVSRAGTNLARTARFARFAGGALSAACLVLEARELNKTMEQIKQGNPCEKAMALRKIKAELNKLPSTTVVDGMCQCYLKVMENHARKKEQEAKQEIVSLHSVNELELMEEVVSSLEAQHDSGSVSEGEENEVSLTTAVAPPRREQQQKVNLSKSSLLERIQLYKARQAKQLSHQQAEIDLVA